MIPVIRPILMASPPRSGPTVRSSMTVSGAGRGACAQKRGEDDRILNGEAAADLAGAARDRLADDRRAQHLAVENDGEGAVDVLGGDIRELACTEAVETERNDRLIGPRVEAARASVRRSPERAT